MVQEENNKHSKQFLNGGRGNLTWHWPGVMKLRAYFGKGQILMLSNTIDFSHFHKRTV